MNILSLSWFQVCIVSRYKIMMIRTDQEQFTPYMFGSKKLPWWRWSEGEGMKWWLLRLGADLFSLSSPSPITDWPEDRGTLRVSGREYTLRS